MGALSQHGGQLFAKLISTTNAEEVEQFFKDMVTRHNLVGSVVILDQHRAHHAIRVRELFKELQCQLVFLPIETLWSTTKRQFRKRLIEHEPAHMSQAWMRSELSRILARFDEEKLENHARSHYCEVIHARVERAY